MRRDHVTDLQAIRPLPALPPNIRHSVDPAVLSAFAADESGRHGTAPWAVVMPATVADVQHIVKWAVKRQVPLMPVSSAGGPRRRGDTVSERAGVVVDLSEMKRVIHVDGRDAVAIIEPGVTFPALDLLLKPHGLRTYQPLAARGSKSVLSAFLEREPITVPSKHWDAADPLASMEVVFGTGEVFRTGGASLPGTLDDNLARGNRQLIAPGPSFTDFGRVLQGSQGTLGIVVWASLLCERIPAAEVPLFAASDDLGPVVDLCYRMLRRRTVGQLFIVNRVQLAMLLSDDAAGFAALISALPRWILFVELVAASAYFPDEAIAFQRADLERDAAALGVTVSDTLADQPAAAVPRRQRAFAGVPAHHRVGRVSQEVFGVSQLDAAAAQHDAVTALGGGHAELAVYLQPMAQGVNAHCQFTWLDQPGREAALAHTATAAAETLSGHRLFLNRPYHPWAHVAFAGNPSVQSMSSRTKALFDPANILKPGGMPPEHVQGAAP